MIGSATLDVAEQLDRPLTPRPSERRLSLRGVTRVWFRNATIYRRTFKFNILPNFFEPVFYLLSMGVGLGAYVAGVADSYLAWVAPGLLAASAMNGATFEVTYNIFVKIVFDRTYDAMLSTPLSVEDITVGEILWAVTRSGIYGVAFLTVMAIFGLIRSPLALLAIPASLLIGFLFAGIGLTYTALNKKIDLYSYYFTLFITPLFLFSEIFFPLERLPDVLKTLALFTPLYHAVRLCRFLVLGEGGEAALVSVIWIAVVSSALFFLSIRLMRRRLIR
jgi:lipooligosaccharide transport system permease protein